MSYLKIKVGLSTAAPPVLSVSQGKGAMGSVVPWGISLFFNISLVKFVACPGIFIQHSCV